MPLGNPSGPFDGFSFWKKDVIRRALSINGSINTLITNEYDTSSASDMYMGTSGTVTYDTGLSGGVAKLKTGGALAAYAVVNNAGGSVLVGDPDGESWYTQARCWIKNSPTALTTMYCVGLQSAPTSGPYVALGLVGSVSDTYLTLRIVDGGTTNQMSNVAADLNGFHDYGIGRDAVNDKIYALVDDTPILELDGPFANLTSTPCFFYSSVGSGTLGLQDVELWADNIATAVVGV